MVKRALITTFLLILLCTSINAQPKGSLRGIVRDKSNGEVLAYANILVKELNIGASTDTKGHFIIRAIPSNSFYTIRISYVGYEAEELQVQIKTNKITHIDVELLPSEHELQTVEKIGERIEDKKKTDLSIERITIKDIQNLPRGVETDIFRSLQSLPGVKSTGDVSARYYVRGGGSNQNLVSINSIPIYNPFHALGMFSVIDPEIISSAEFYKGGFTSELGGRLSSILNVNTKEGNDKRYSGSFGSSFLTAKALAEGPIPYGSFILSARKSHSNDILKEFVNDDNVPADFLDITFKMNYDNQEFLKNGRFSILGFYTNDKLEYSNPQFEDYKWTNQGLGLNYFQLGDGPLFYEVKIFTSMFDGELIPKESNNGIEKNELRDFTIQADFTYVYDSNDELSVGSKIQDVKTKLTLENQLGVERSINDNGANISIYGKYKLLRFEKFFADFGTRINLTRMSTTEVGTSLIEPRISLRYNLNNWISLKAAWGKYNQELTTLSDENEIITIFEPWIITPSYLEPARATHYIIGAVLKPQPNLSMDAEVYYKTISNLPALNENKRFSTDPDLVAGEGESYGLELSGSYFNDIFRFSSSYSLSWSYKTIGELEYHPRYDSRHSVNLLLEAKLGSGWLASASWYYSSGSPFTQIAGFYDKYNPNEFTGNELLNSYFPQVILDDRNEGRLPDYHRLDLSISKKMMLAGFVIYINGSLLNVYDRDNMFYYKKETGERVNMLPFLPTATIKVEL